MTLKRKVRLFVADKNRTTRARIRLLAQSRADIEVVGEAASGRELLTKAPALNPDVVLVNVVSIAEAAWLDFVESLAQRSPTIRAVLTGLGEESEHLSSLLETVVSVMEQPASKDLLTIGLSMRRDAALSFARSPEKLGNTRTPQAMEPSIARGSLLSPREHQVLLLLAEGYSNREIAEGIFRSVKTVETYRSIIKKKLGLRNRADIVRYVRAESSVNRSA